MNGEWGPREHYRSDDGDTSRAAAHSMEADAPTLMLVILACVKQHGPLIFSEIAQRTGIPAWQVTKRLSDLKNKNLIQPSGVTRPGPSGRQQTVWQVATGQLKLL